MKTGSQKMQGSRQVGPHFSLGAQGFSEGPSHAHSTSGNRWG